MAALAEFVVSTRPSFLPIFKASQMVSRTVTSSEVELIATYFSEKPCRGKSVPSVPELVPGAAKIVERHRQKFMANQYFIRRKAKAALKSYAKEKVIFSFSFSPIFVFLAYIVNINASP